MSRHTTTREVPVMVRALNGVEQAEALDAIADRLQPAARALVKGPGRRRVLLGHDLGHALHAPLTDVPVGSWLSAAILDVVGGTGAQPAARRLLGVGLLAALPTAVSGWAEWASTEGASRRVGLAHALANSAVLGLYVTSWVLRLRGRNGLGVAVSMTANAGLLAAAELGGHLTLGRKVGSRHPQFENDHG